MELRKATRQKAKLRIGITAPSGAGKTYSAILIANGIALNKEKVAIIDTENGSADLYADMGDFSVIRLEAPYTPERYIEAIKECEKASMEVIIIDSATHEWDGKGGCLEIQEQLGGKYQDWAKVTPRHRKFLEAILSSPAHIITTTRRKQDYEMNKDGSGKTKVEKVGLKEVQREGFEYELTLNFELDTRHNASASKDRTGLFADKPEFVITEDTGRILRDWANSGVEPILPPDPSIAANKKKIMQLIPMMGYILPAEKENIKAYIDQTVLKLTDLELKDENLGDIVDRLEILYKEKRDNPNRHVAPSVEDADLTPQNQ